MFSVAVMPSKYEESWVDEKSPARWFRVRPLADVLADTYTSDAHSLSYRLLEPGPCPRVNRQALGRLNVVSDVVFIDLDRPNHEPWEDRWQCFETFHALVRLFPHAAVYTTKGGARVVFLLDAAREPHAWSRTANLISKAVATLVEAAGLPVQIDETTAQWSRCFRLPNVIRDGSPTWESPFHNLHIPDPWPTVRGRHNNPTETRVVVTLPLSDSEQPTLDFDRELSAAEWDDLQRALSMPLMMRGWPDLLNKLRAGQTFYARGERNSTMFRALSATFEAYFEKFQKDDPDVLFAMFRASAAASTGTPGDESVQELFDMVGRMAHVETYMRDPAHDVISSRDLATPYGILPMVVYTGGQGRYVWDPARHCYSPPIVNDTSFCSAVRTLHGSDNPALAAMKTADILDNYGQYVDNVTLDLRVTAPRIEVTQRDRALVLPVGKRTPISAVFHSDVSDWLDVLGGDDLDGLLTWLKFCTTHDRPKAALYLGGASRAGKSMLAEAVAAFYGGHFVAFKDAVGPWPGALRDTPFVWLDETQARESGTKAVTGPFRQLVANTSHKVVTKYAMPETLKGCLTVLITANGEDALPLDDIKTPADVDAIKARVRFIHVADAATAWLRERGGRKLTAEWVTKEDGSAGKLCEHIAWLRDNYEPEAPIGEDFLAQGPATPWHTRALYNGVVGVLLGLITSEVARNNPKQSQAFFDPEVGVLVDSIGIFQGAGARLRTEGFTLAEARSALTHLSKGEVKRHGRVWDLLDESLLRDMPRQCYPTAGAHEQVAKLLAREPLKEVA